jgi:intracellular sulfur oxidation DsrE/DsrF family protein
MAAAREGNVRVEGRVRSEGMSSPHDRRAILAGLSAVAAAQVLDGTPVQAQTSAPPFSPTLHAQDAWMSSMRGKHRVVLDVTSPTGVPDGIRFAGNIFTGNKTGYDVDEADVAIILVLRHAATAYGYSDAVWAKYGKVLDANAAQPPTANPYNSGERQQLSALAKRGVQFMVCATASRGISGRIAQATGGQADAVFKEITSALVPSARLVAAGVVGVTHAQDHGFALLHVG